MTGRITVRDIIAHVAADYAVTPDLILGPNRSRIYARPRQMVMFLARRLCEHLSYPEMGRRIGNRDRTTAMHGVKTTLALIAADPMVARRAARLEHELRERFALEWRLVTREEAAIPFHVLCRDYAAAIGGRA